MKAWLRAFWNRAYREGVTGQAAMVAYNLMLSVFPFALVVLFIFGQVLKSPSAEASALLDLKRLLPSVDQTTLTHTLDRVRDSSTTLGIIGALGSIWIGASFWGAMDTAFGRIYHVPSRSWIQQKRFSLGMVGVSLLLIAAGLAVPVAEGALISSTKVLPLGLSEISFLPKLLLIGGTLTLAFGIACVIYWAVPKGHMPWRSVWPGALLVTLTTGIANWAFPFYLSHISGAGRLGGTIGFVSIALIWFYVLALLILAGAVINSLRHELDETGSLPVYP